MRFRSKIDTWLVVLLASASAVALLACLPLVSRGTPGDIAIAALVLLPALALPVWPLVATQYSFEGDDLLIRSGPFRWRVPISEVRSVTPTRSMLSSPALSLERLRIDHGRNRSIMVSPADKEGFLRELNARRSEIPG
ncbi:MAG: PH domain-containing protein [Gemmatimonadales bacterium]|nr:PH domain-containing protein [Gemmatimonadales bacterium]